MQVLFKTRYEDDLRFLAKTGEKVRVGLVVAFLLAAPLFLFGPRRARIAAGVATIAPASGNSPHTHSGVPKQY